MSNILNCTRQNPIHYIYHISDIHINCDKRHDEYKIIFDTFYKKIKNNSAVIITGNLLNSKSRITSKQIILARNFLFNISQKCPLIIIPGKLDKYENIMAIITNGNLPLNNINFLTEKGNYILNNINFSYFTDQFLTTNITTNITTDIKTNTTNNIKIGLYHGGVESYDLYSGKHSTNKTMKLKHFDNCNYTLLGGITKTQFINKEKTIAYAGSMIQKNHKEDWRNHGYILLDLKENTIRHFHLKNNYRFVKIKILDEKLMTPLECFPKNLYVEWNITETGSGMESKINKIQNDIKNKFNIIEETYNYNSFTKEIKNEDNFTFDLSIDKQKSYAIEWLKSNGTIIEEKEQKELFNLIEKYNNKIKFEKKPFIKWKLIKLEFENILCYRKKQSLFFENFKNINGIIAENNAGKSALFDILTFSLFGKCSRADTYSYNDLINVNSESNLQTSVVIKDDNNIYIIKRYILNKKLKITIIKNNIIIHENSLREATTYLANLIGTYDDFMTTCFMAQNNIHNFLLMTGKNQKDFISRIFQLNIYDKLHKLLKNDNKSFKNKIKELKEKINSFDEKNITENITSIENETKELKENKSIICSENKTYIEKKKNLVLKPLLFDNNNDSILSLQNNLNHLVNKISSIKNNFKDLDTNTLESLEDELHNNKVEDNEILWNEINKLCNKLKELRGKKIKHSKYSSFDKRLKKITKTIKSSNDFLQNNECITPSIKILETEIKNLTETLPNLNKLNNKYLDKIYNLYNVSPCNIENEFKKIKDKFNENLIENNENLIKNKNNLLKNKYKLEFKIKNIIITKKDLSLYEYNPNCKYCCNNTFVIEAKNKLKDEKNITEELKNINNKLEIIEIKLLNKKIKLFEKGLNEFKTKEHNEKILHDTNNKIKNKNNKLKKLNKIILVKENLEKLKKIKDIFITNYNNSKKINKIKNKIKNIKKINQCEKDLYIIKNSIKIKEENKIIKDNNNKINYELNLINNSIEINNRKNINFIKKETELQYKLKEFKKDYKILKEFKNNFENLENNMKIMKYFISLTHHSGVPFFLIKKITLLLQNTVNNVLSKYTDIKVKIKNLKETSIKIYNEKYNNGLNARMLCGSEIFLVELAFRIGFQSLSTVSKPNFFICDEGWSCLDENKINKLNTILKTINEYNDYMLTVSHIQSVKKWINTNIHITIDNNGYRNISIN